MTETIRHKYIEAAIVEGILPNAAHRMASVVSLSAPNDITKPIQFWQLYSVLGPQRIVNIVGKFYARVFDDDPWFTSVFARIGGVGHHVNTQASMWVDVMGGGPAYHGAEFRLNFHHTHNAMSLMNERGAKHWVNLMVETLDASSEHMTEDARVRPSLNTFLAHFLAKYAADFKFSIHDSFGDTNPPLKRKINFMNMTSDAIEALSEDELKEALSGRGIDVSDYRDKQALVNKALSL
ncbi:MAG: hypothetical protein ABJN26_26050 [Stappiaceae bacterium]